MRESLWLVKNNVPFDVAFSLRPKMRMAWSIIISEFDGSKFNWDQMRFEDPE